MIRTSHLITFDRECKQYFIALSEQLAAPKPLPLIVNGLSPLAADALICETVKARRSTEGSPTVIVVVPEEKELQSTVGTLRDGGITAYRLPYRDMIFDSISASHDIERERLFVLHAIATHSCDAVVTTLPALLQLTMPKKRLTELCRELRVGDIAEPDELSELLTVSGYARVDTVESAGQYCRRGGIIDICITPGMPVRIEFFGDEIDRMGYFSPETQRMCGECESLTLIPAMEILPDSEAEQRVAAHLRRRLKKGLPPEADGTANRDISAITSHTGMYSRDKYLNLIYPDAECGADYIQQRTTICLCGSSEIFEKLQSREQLTEQTVSQLIEDMQIDGKYASFSRDKAHFDSVCSVCVPIYINQFSGVSASMACGGLFGFRCRHTPSYRDNLKMLCDDIEDYMRGMYRVLVLCTTPSEASAVAEAIADRALPATLVGDSIELSRDSMPAGAILVGVSPSKGGFDLPNAKVALLSMAEDETTLRRRRIRTPKKKVRSGEQILSYNELSVGDYVVHETYGIGIFDGISKIRNVDGVSRDYITISYLGTDKLFVPADRLEMISKYIGAGSDDHSVKLSKMGSPEWQKTKARAKGAAKDLARDLVALYAARSQTKGYAFPPDGALEQEFEEAFEFEETDVQLIAASEIKRDMERPVPMDRLLCGDVGFGKTEVALRAAFKAICAGKQVALLVPTTILALQHYQTALSRMRSFPVTVEMLSRFRTATEQTKILRRLERGDIDLIVGTHSLLSKRVRFRDLGLLIVDEEQRFGVAQKEKLKQLAKNVDVLTLTATPIPRTLHMAMSGIRDMSILDEAPTDRFPVQTYVSEHDEGLILEAIGRELRRGGQVLYLHNRTDSIATTAGRIARALPEARVTWAHGQMDREELEDIWQSLVRGDVDILVCTTIIETGVDLPNANTLIIEDADRMGLSQLHQLRGRVGRSGRRAYAYFTFRPGKSLTDIAAKRLEAIREYAEFGAGFRIAMRDLEIRGAGNLLGAEQHGNIDAVGYDLYVRILNQAILEHQGTVITPPFESTVEIPVDALIPDSYITSSSQRMEMYKKISHILTYEDYCDILDEFCDRFGEPPQATLRLLSIALIRATASHCHISKVEQRQGEIRFVCEKIDLSLWSEIFASTDGMRVVPGSDPLIAARLKRGDDPVKVAEKILLSYRKLHDGNNESAEVPK